MSYLGNEPPQIAGYSTQTKAAPVGSSITLNQEGTVNSILLFLDGVRQTPTTDYTVSGTTLTLTSTAPTTAVATILFLGDVTDMGVPSDDAVNVAQLDTTSAGTTGQYLRKTGASSIDWDDAATDTSGIEDDIALLGFKVAVNGSLAKYNLVDQTEDAFMDASGVDTGGSTNADRNSSNYYSVGGGTPTATGGTITTYGAYTIHSFLSGTSDYVNDTTQATDILVVAGGGGGGTGGGGAGGMLTSAALSVAAGTYSVTVGDGGATSGSTAGRSTSGSNSSFPTLTAIGGGGGGRNDNGYGGSNGPLLGGSGGGVGATSTTGLTVAPGTAGQGNAGGTNPSASAPGYAGSGGGGAGAVGVNGSGTANGNGGVGLENDYRTGSNVFYAGGGAGGNGGGTSSGGTGGSGGGGNAGADGTVNTGGGGGGGSPWGDGGSGIVVLRRATTIATPASMTLKSNATEAESTPTKGDLVMTYTNGSGTATLNTDLKAYISRDDGSTWTQLTLASKGSTGSHLIVSSHNVDISSQPDDKTMRYKIETLNQSGSKVTQIQAVSLGWS